MSSHGTNDLVARRGGLIRKLGTGERPVWVTVLYDWWDGNDLVIGASNKQACIDAFDRLSYGAPCNPDLVTFSAFRKMDVTGYGFACFRAATLTALKEVQP